MTEYYINEEWMSTVVIEKWLSTVAKIIELSVKKIANKITKLLSPL
jgi:hypothetical protein